MLFHSVGFFLLLGAVLVARAVLPWRFGRLVLLAASYTFYGAAHPAYCLLLAASTLVDWLVALGLERTEARGPRRLLLGVSLVVNLGLLGSFKYGDFVLENVGPLLGTSTAAPLGWALPIGISFYTFQTLSSTLDVYRRKTRACRDPITYALYVSFFPQLVAGPIERKDALLPQLERKQRVSAADLEAGLQRILWGLVKKLVIADRLFFLVSTAFGAPEDVAGSTLALATVAATFAIYLDFSAYTDIAIGVARLLGVRLSENFAWPLLAASPADFWRRWHVTLTTWFRDYVSRPLGGRLADEPVADGARSGAVAALRTVFVMTLVGAWHGARWHFVVFGVVAGLGLALTSWRRGVLKARGSWDEPRGASRLLRIAGTFLYVNLCMVLFVSGGLGNAWTVLTRTVVGPWAWEPFATVPLLLVVGVAALHVARGLGARGLGAGGLGAGEPRRERALSPAWRGAFWAAMVLAVLYGVPDRVEPFVYFQF